MPAKKAAAKPKAESVKSTSGQTQDDARRELPVGGIVADRDMDWRDPDAKFAANDESVQARLWRMSQAQQGKA